MLANEFETPPSPKAPNSVGTASLVFTRNGYLNVNITVDIRIRLARLVCVQDFLFVRSPGLIVK